MSPPLTYLPAYVGLYASLVLALTCNAFLDIGYGSFGTEVLIWAMVFGVTLWVGWRQHGNPSERARKWQKGILLVGALVSLLIFIPMWRFPRAGIYMLATVQAAYNCTTTTRRHLHLGVLVAGVMAMFAASHIRADWTMLFYLVPFVVAVVFTLVAEQVNRRAEDVRAHSLGQQVIGGQGMAIVAASSVILSTAALLYAITPQVSWTHLMWRYGVDAGAGPGKGDLIGGAGNLPLGPGGDLRAGSARGNSASSGDASSGGGLTVESMRQSARTPGMPDWQVGMINALANIAEGVDKLLSPFMQRCVDLWEAFKEWLREHIREVVFTVAVLLLLALLVALRLLLREASIGIWLATRMDFVRYVILGWHAPGRDGASQLYLAMERLFALQDCPRLPTTNTREYLAELCAVRSDLRAELAEITLLFEGARYGSLPPAENQLTRMRRIYRKLFANAY